MDRVARLRSPIVLVHGLLGYDEFRLRHWTLARYFADIPAFLRAAGNRVLVARLSPTRGVASRAAELKAFLDRHAARQAVHLFAHSMGGLDSRYMISRLGMASRVLTLTTIGTPHRGTVFANWGLRRLGCFLRPVFDWLDLPEDAFHDLTTDRCRKFNEQVPDAPTVRYFSVAGQLETDWRAPEWHLPYRIVAEAEGPNDGLVSVASARYGERLDIWKGDHVSLVNGVSLLSQARGLYRDRSRDFAELMRRLANEGF